MLASQLTLKQGNQEPGKPVPVTDSEAIAVKHLIEGLAKKYNLDVPVTVEKDAHIKVGIAKQEEGEAGQPKPPADLKGADGKEKKKTAKDFPLLNNYDGMVGFLNSIAGIPYILEYESGCVGQTCGEGLELTIIVKKMPPVAG